MRFEQQGHAETLAIATVASGGHPHACVRSQTLNFTTGATLRRWRRGACAVALGSRGVGINGSTSLLEVRSLDGARGDLQLFENLSLTIESGACLQVLGTNGGGKTTLLRIIAGLYSPERGAVRWRGASIHNNLDFRRAIIYLGHDNGLKSDLSVAENLRAASQLAGGRLLRDVDSALDEVGLSGFGPLRLGSLSAGQRRRVALARLAHEEATLWILDEPFTALDERGVVLVRDLIRTHIRAQGAVIFTSHQGVGFETGEIQELALAS
ncbi:MAG: cytochrome c biogenesis heme-transporting ATPase CcmA [Gammaproteobacteria bacterium]|nr:cytochrome c biogenesis heme-transporting ATPase CcmA [Gammaproteobacteria bacterium]